MNESGQNSMCEQIKQSVENDLLQIQLLQRQRAATSNGAALAQIDAQITAVEQHLAALEQQAQTFDCPALATER